MSTSLRLGVAEFRARPGRALLPGVALVVGVACLLAALVLSDALTRSVDEGAPLTPSSVSHVVDTKPAEYGTAEANRPKLDDAVLARLSAVGRAVPVQVAQADLLDANGRAGQHRAEVHVQQPDLVRWPLAQGKAPAANGEVAVDKITAYERGLKPGDRIKLAAADGKPVEVTVSGVMKKGGMDARPILVAGPDLARALDPEPFTKEIWVLGGARDAVKAAAGASYVVGDAAPDAGSIGNDLRYILLPFSVLALATAVFVAAATFRAVYAQRQRQTALLRCIGAQRGPLVRRSLFEAFVTGAAAGVGGALLGGPMAWLLARTFDATGISVLFGAVELSPELLPSLGYVILGVVVAALLSVMAAVRPAINAARVSPLAALRDADSEMPPRSVRRLRLVFGVLFTGGAALLAMMAIAAKGTVAAPLAVTFSAIAAVTGLFWILGPVTVPFIARLFGKIGGTQWKLAGAEVRRMPQRSASVALPLLLASSMVTFFLVLLGGAQEMTYQYANEERPDATVVDAGDRPLPAIPAQPDVAASVVLHKTPDGAASVDPEEFKAWLKAQNVSGAEQLTAGTAIVPPHWEDRPFVEAGGKQYQVVGTIPGSITGYTPIIAGPTSGPAEKVLVALKPGVDPARFRAGLQAALPNNPTVIVQTDADERAEADRYMHLGTVLMMVLLGLSVAVAVTGIGTALTISVQERRKELALRRALGVTRGGLQGGVIAEAIMLALVGVIGGGVLGFGYAEIAILSTGIDMSLPGLKVVLPLVIGAAAVVVLAVLAAFGPSRGASRIRPAAGLASG
ncbi:putative ABC transport system permease protein [Lentzea albidocapillata subsp. violacea]|uniref:Putative ABC transport system permease protein n=1 Tax=Lentzea albidocapillata subsp. violacea TaxID=128104 RepID=A0A1G8Z9N2_9PSEU|nr:FtsX-like permease family protein [Lentzea albidocapillata]SDK11115.1 putative ABC transport system permease protein [Lentzea albidocapillata subsp. violacea]